MVVTVLTIFLHHGVPVGLSIVNIGVGCGGGDTCDNKGDENDEMVCKKCHFRFGFRFRSKLHWGLIREGREG